MFIRVLLCVTGFFVLLILYVRFLERTSLFAPSKSITLQPDHIGLSFEEVYFLTPDSIKLHAWYIPSERSQTVVLFCHGNAGNVSGRLGKIEQFHSLGLNIFIFDYRGYGKSEGSPTERGMYSDAMAAFDYLVQERGIAPEHIVVYGASLGGAAAVDVISKKEPAALILDSTFSNAVDMARFYYPHIPSVLVSIKLDSLSKIKNVKKPVLFFHSKDDDIVPYKLGRKLYEAANDPKEFITLQGDHNDGHMFDYEKFTGGIKRFLEREGLL